MNIYEYNEEEHIRMERADAYEDGVAEGLAAGREELFELINRMTADGLGNLTSRLASDPAFYQEMRCKYLSEQA